MSLTFWKFCDLALVACKDRCFEESFSLCNKAFASLDDSLDESIIEGRKKFIDNLIKYVTERKNRVSSQTVSEQVNVGDNFEQSYDISKQKLVAENKILKQNLMESPFIDPLCISDSAYKYVNGEKSDFGIIVFGHTRLDSLQCVLESLKKQGALQYTEVWLDGDQGKPDLKIKVNETIKLVKTYPVKHINTQRGNYGFRKMILLGLSAMAKKYNDILILEDDCFPVNGAIDEFRVELDHIRDKKDIFSVYGHHFGCEDVNGTFARFQGWGWATTSEKLMPVLRQLIDCYSMPEHEYLKFVDQYFTEEIQAIIEITPPRLPSHTLKNFFAWDETLCLLSALNGQVHKPTKRRTIYNCGMGNDSTHFPEQKVFRNPPFNMISPNEVWDYFGI